MKPIILKLARDDLMEIRDRLSEYGVGPPKKFRESFEKFCTNVTAGHEKKKVPVQQAVGLLCSLEVSQSRVRI